jgi:kynurenine formamidase
MLVDVSHVVEHGMITYKGLPAPLVCDFLSREQSRSHYAPGTEFHIGKIEMVANTGTYLDSPFHRYANGKDLADLPLTSLANLPIELIQIPANTTRIDATFFKGRELVNKAVLIQTNWSKHWRTDTYFENHPHITADAATHLRDAGAALVGIDSYNIDDTNDGARPAHSILLAAEIPIVEHMTNLAALADTTEARFFAVPVKVRTFGTFPVRAFALCD